MTLKKPLKTEVKSEPESKELTSQCIIVNDDDNYDVDGFFHPRSLPLPHQPQ